MTDNERDEEGCVFEIAVVVPKLGESKGDERDEAHCVDVLVDELRAKGLIVERVVGLQNEFIKVNSSLSLSLSHNVGDYFKILSFHQLIHEIIDYVS